MPKRRKFNNNKKKVISIYYSRIVEVQCSNISLFPERKSLEAEKKTIKMRFSRLMDFHGHDLVTA